jgi:hypothetical protein
MRTAPRTATVLLPTALAVVLGLAGCGNDQTASTAQSATPPATSSAPATAPSPAQSGASAAAAAPTGTGPRSREGMPSPASLLTAIRTAHQPSYDRLVFDFAGPRPGYRVEYVPSITEDPSDRPVALKGGAFLRVVFQGATLDTAQQSAPGATARRYTGPKRLTPGLPAVKDIAAAGDFEAVLSFGIGVDHKAGFRVLELNGPSRIVIDVATPASS